MEVPPRVAPSGFGKRAEQGVGRLRPRVELTEHGEAHPVIHSAHLLRAVGAFELLPPEVSGGRPQHHKALFPVARIEALEACELGRKAALAGRVHNE